MARKYFCSAKCLMEYIEIKRKEDSFSEEVRKQINTWLDQEEKYGLRRDDILDLIGCVVDKLAE